MAPTHAPHEIQDIEPLRVNDKHLHRKSSPGIPEKVSKNEAR